MFIKTISDWISRGQPTQLASSALEELNSTGWISSLPNKGWVLIGESNIFGVCAFYDDEKYPDKTIYQMKDGESFVDFGIPQSYNCWIVQDTYIYEAFTRKKYQNTQVGSSLLFLSKCYVSNKGEDLIAPTLMSEDAALLYKNVSELYGEPYTMDPSYVLPMPEKLFHPWGGKFVR